MCAVQVGPGVYAFDPGDIRPASLLFEYTVENAHSGEPEAYYCICETVADVAHTCAEILRAQIEVGALELEAYADYLRGVAFVDAAATAAAAPGRTPDEALLDKWISWQSDRLMGLHLTYIRSQSGAVLAGVVEIIRQYNFGDVSWIEALASYVEDSQEYLLDRVAAMHADKGSSFGKSKITLPGDEKVLAELFSYLNERN